MTTVKCNCGNVMWRTPHDMYTCPKCGFEFWSPYIPKSPPTPKEYVDKMDVINKKTVKEYLIYCFQTWYDRYSLRYNQEGIQKFTKYVNDCLKHIEGKYLPIYTFDIENGNINIQFL